MPQRTSFGSATDGPSGTSGTTSRADARIRFREVTKVFDGTTALDHVSFDVRRGEIHALLGANGAGKSTLIKVLAGYYQPDGGAVELHDEADGSRHGVAFIHQDLALIPALTVAENIALVAGYPRSAGRIDWDAVGTQARNALAAVSDNHAIDVDVRVDTLNRADQSIVAIARALLTPAAALVLDEPTASLPDADVARLFAILLDLAAVGVSIVYVTHRLDEVRRIADWVTVLRDGSVVADKGADEMSDDDIVTAIVGGVLIPHQRTQRRPSTDAVLNLTDGRLTAHGEPLTFDIRCAEIVGLAGLRGSGQEEVGRALAGIAALPAGAFRTCGRPIRLGSVRAALAAGIGFATSRREAEALAMTLSIGENLFLNPPNNWRANPVSRRHRERAAAARLTAALRLRPADPDAPVSTLSGGNQQKVVLGRWLDVPLRILVLEEPTMGIDVGARAEIYEILARLAAQGLAIVVISSDFEELAAICHRVLVFDRGAIRAELQEDDVDVATLTYLAAGGTRNR